MVGCWLWRKWARDRPRSRNLNCPSGKFPEVNPPRSRPFRICRQSEPYSANPREFRPNFSAGMTESSISNKTRKPFVGVSFMFRELPIPASALTPRNFAATPLGPRSVMLDPSRWSRTEGKTQVAAIASRLCVESRRKRCQWYPSNSHAINLVDLCSLVGTVTLKRRRAACPDILPPSPPPPEDAILCRICSGDILSDQLAAVVQFLSSLAIPLDDPPPCVSAREGALSK